MIIFTDISDFSFPFSIFPSEWLKGLILSENKKLGNLSYIAVTIEKIWEINRQFLNHDYPTDIITFDQVRGKSIHGEIFFCPEVILQNSEDFEVSYSSEYARVLAHGALHLCGYKDKTPEEQDIMRAKENQYLQLLNL